MAYSASVVVKSVWGNVRVAVLSMTADANSGNISGGGIGYLFAATISPVSAIFPTVTCPVKINVLDAGTAANGSVGFSGLTNGDAWYVTLYGRS